MQLFQTHLPAGNVPGVRYESTTHSLAPEGREGLQMADRAPVCDNGIRVALQVHPPGQDIADGSDQEPAVEAEAGDELISHRRDDGGVNRQRAPPRRVDSAPSPIRPARARRRRSRRAGRAFETIAGAVPTRR